MAMTTQQRFAYEHDLMEIAHRYLKGETQWEIGQAVGKDQSTISRSLAVLRKRWQASGSCDMNAAIVMELARIDHLERVAWAAWERSCEDREIKSSEKKADGGSRASIRKEARDGNPAFLERVAWCIARRCAILGLDAPGRFEHAGPEGSPLITSIVVEVPALAHEEAPDGTVESQ